jgi:hypothetical protein
MSAIKLLVDSPPTWCYYDRRLLCRFSVPKRGCFMPLLGSRQQADESFSINFHHYPDVFAHVNGNPKFNLVGVVILGVAFVFLFWIALQTFPPSFADLRLVEGRLVSVTINKSSLDLRLEDQSTAFYIGDDANEDGIITSLPSGTWIRLWVPNNGAKIYQLAAEQRVIQSYDDAFHDSLVTIIVVGLLCGSLLAACVYVGVVIIRFLIRSRHTSLRIVVGTGTAGIGKAKGKILFVFIEHYGKVPVVIKDFSIVLAGTNTIVMSQEQFIGPNIETEIRPKSRQYTWSPIENVVQTIQNHGNTGKVKIVARFHDDQGRACDSKPFSLDLNKYGQPSHFSTIVSEARKQASSKPTLALDHESDHVFPFKRSLRRRIFIAVPMFILAIFVFWLVWYLAPPPLRSLQMMDGSLTNVTTHEDKVWLTLNGQSAEYYVEDIGDKKSIVYSLTPGTLVTFWILSTDHRVYQIALSNGIILPYDDMVHSWKAWLTAALGIGMLLLLLSFSLGVPAIVSIIKIRGSSLKVVLDTVTITKDKEKKKTIVVGLINVDEKPVVANLIELVLVISNTVVYSSKDDHEVASSLLVKQSNLVLLSSPETVVRTIRDLGGSGKVRIVARAYDDQGRVFESKPFFFDLNQYSLDSVATV